MQLRRSFEIFEKKLQQRHQTGVFRGKIALIFKKKRFSLVVRTKMRSYNNKKKLQQNMAKQPSKPTALTPTTGVEVLPKYHEEVVQLRELHEQATARVRDIVKIAITSGEILSKIKQSFPKSFERGKGFYDWVENNLQYSKTTAYHYLKAYANRANLISSDGTSLVKTMRGLTGSEYKDTKANRGGEVPNASFFAVEGITEKKQQELATEATELCELFGGTERALQIAEKYVLNRYLKKPKRKTATTKTRRTRVALSEEEEGALNDLVSAGTFKTFAEASEEYRKVRTKKVLKTFVKRYKPE